MPKMYFATKVKYEGEHHAANTAVEVLDKDVQDLQAAGGWLIEPPIVKETDEELAAARLEAERLEEEEKARLEAEEKAAEIARLEAEEEAERLAEEAAVKKAEEEALKAEAKAAKAKAKEENI